MRIIFSKVASQSYENILEFLSQTWTEKEIGVFIDEAEKVIIKLKEGKFRLYQNIPMIFVPHSSAKSM
jgi:hypothetical protein